MLGQLLRDAQAEETRKAYEYELSRSTLKKEDQHALAKLVTETFHSHTYKQSVLKQPQGLCKTMTKTPALFLKPDRKILGDNLKSGGHYVN